jgi:predicted lipid-binding transport protein (Tim44 family)
MKRRLALVAALSLLLTWLLGVADVAAKSGGGGFRSGGRAAREDDRSFGSGSSDAGTPDAPTPDAPEAPKQPRKPKTWRSMARGLLTGGVIGSIFYGRSFGGVGLLEVIVLSGLIALAFWALSRYHLEQTEHLAPAGAYGGGAGVFTAPGAGRDPGELGRADPVLDTAGVADAVGDIFLRVQAAWTARDIAQAADVLTVEMRERLDRECARLRASRRINRVERITLGRVAVMETRQDGGWDRVTVQIVATLVDYTTDEVGLKVLEGNPFDPVPFQERWELVRPSGPHPWRVSAIQ